MTDNPADPAAIDLDEIKENWDSLGHNDEDRDVLIATVEALRAALTPSVETKAAYLGEFKYCAEQIDENGDTQPVTYYVPWPTIKEIMAAILERASSSVCEADDD